MENVSVQICTESDFTERQDLTQKCHSYTKIVQNSHESVDRGRNALRDTVFATPVQPVPMVLVRDLGCVILDTLWKDRWPEKP
jgi:hypothetical protein